MVPENKPSLAWKQMFLPAIKIMFAFNMARLQFRGLSNLKQPNSFKSTFVEALF